MYPHVGSGMHIACWIFPIIVWTFEIQGLGDPRGSQQGNEDKGEKKQNIGSIVQ